MHIIIRRPLFADETKESIEIFFRKEQVEQGNACVNFDGEIPVGRGNAASSGNANEFGEKMLLLCASADVFYDSIGITDIKSIVCKRQCCAIGYDRLDMRVSFLKMTEIFVRHDRDVLGKGIVFFEVVIGS